MKKKYHSVDQVLEIVNKLESTTKRLPDLLGFKSSDISKSYKKLISLCNSLSIIFEQYDIHNLALQLLRKASDADKGLKKHGSGSDKLWQGSLVTSCNLALLFHKVGQYPASVKLVYEAQSFMVLLKESEEYLSADIEICVQMITFVTLWKLKKFSDAKEYLESAAEILNKIIKGIIDSKMSKNSCQNLYCLIVMSLAALKITENNLQEARDMCEDCRSQLESNSLAEKLVSSFVSRIGRTKEDFLITGIYQKILFVTTFMPLISPNTPLIRVSDLEAQQSSFLNKDDSKISYKTPSKKIRTDNSSLSKRPCRSTPRSGLVRPWWESNKILEKNPKSRENDLSFKTEPRAQKFSYPVNRTPKKISREAIFSDVNLRKEEKELIMFEFNPGFEEGTGEYQIQLVPLRMFKVEKEDR